MTQPRLPHAVLCVLLIAVSAGCQSARSSGTQTASTPSASTPSASPLASPVGIRAAPRWEGVTTLSGTGTSAPAAFQIRADAIQWRVRYRCATGRLRVSTEPASRTSKPTIDAGCPAKGAGYSIVTGTVRVKVEAAGAWSLVVDQQVDTPLAEPPLPGMNPGSARTTGAFYPVDMKGRGVATLYALPRGRYALRLVDFEVTQNQDLFLWASQVRSPRTGAQAVSAPHVVLGPLKATAGEQNYLLPRGLNPEKVRALVVWCEPAQIAYAAATLRPPPAPR